MKALLYILNIGVNILCILAAYTAATNGDTVPFLLFLLMQNTNSIILWEARRNN